MAKLEILGQRCVHAEDRVLIRGAFSQKKILWDAILSLVSPRKIDDFVLVDDMGGKTVPASYKNICDRLRLTGRVTLAGEDGVKEFLIIETEINEIRGWDVDDSGEVISNPVKK